jgi:hypothetical protein
MFIFSILLTDHQDCHFQRNHKINICTPLKYVIQVFKIYRIEKFRVTSRKMRFVGYITYMGEVVSAYTGFVKKPKKKKLLGGYRCRWSDNIKVVFAILQFSISSQ